MKTATKARANPEAGRDTASREMTSAVAVAISTAGVTTAATPSMSLIQIGADDRKAARNWDGFRNFHTDERTRLPPTEHRATCAKNSVASPPRAE